MGYALAAAARDRGASVTLISTVELESPYGVDLVPVERAGEMHEAVLGRLEQSDVLVMAAAVADYQPAQAPGQKIKKDDQRLAIELTPTKDILADVARWRGERKSPVVVGFAAETENLLEHAQSKLQRKRLDLLVANDVSLVDSGFGSDYNTVVLLRSDGSRLALPRLTKVEVAHRIWDEVLEIGRQRSP
jgi:phosphopantothenoylcysteine decarboxylase/phosphopantothenate--cysteine ligase